MSDLQRLLTYVKPHWLTFTIALVAMFFVAVFETAIGALLVPLVNQFLPNPSESKTIFDLSGLIPRDDWYQAWLVIAGLLLAFTICKGIAEYFSSYLMAKIGQTAVLDLRRQLYDHLLRQSAAFFERHRTNFLVSRIVVNCASIELAVSANLRDVLRESLMLIFFVAAAFYYSWRLMLGAIVLVPVMAFLTSNFSRRIRKMAEISLEGNKALNDTAQETLSNHQIVAAYRGEQREIGRFRKVAELIARANLRSQQIAAFSPPTIDIVGTVAAILLIYFGLNEINSGRLDAAQFVAFLFFLFRMYDPMRKISRQHNEINKAFAAARDVWEILDDDESIVEKENAAVAKPLSDKIELQTLSFNYRNHHRKVLANIELEIPRGSMIALVGESGGGKSTLVKLVQRLYDPTEGSILWDGTDIRELNLASLRKHIALVTQETILFNESVAYNISYGDPDASLEDIKRAAKVAFADDFIEQLPEGYDTIVGERGTKLSGGQRQRIAIARAVLIDAPVLILDEATSALDNESEQLVQRALSNLMENRTSIVIAHRLSTVRKADKIVVMEKGRIIESGTHNELIAAEGKYRKLHEFQSDSE
ncbi:MAG TPA: ABC transporter transmembrane domain-containing protein [Pyrinomonadaceae bacterium]|nr:ABC transporter transmembrane domain-containing protein [Pyrinomonadaceae bacterium]